MTRRSGRRTEEAERAREAAERARAAEAVRDSEQRFRALATAEDHRAVIENRGLRLDVDAGEHSVLVDADETRLAQVIGNLLHNAAKFTPSRGRVAVKVEVGDGCAAIRVSDTGPGIAPDVPPASARARGPVMPDRRVNTSARSA